MSNDDERMLELFGSAACPFTAELREQLEWDRRAFVEYDVERDAAARARLLQLTGGQRMVPVLVEDGHVAQIGWNGRGCFVGEHVENDGQS
jgi:glutaredoxin 3